MAYFLTYNTFLSLPQAVSQRLAGSVNFNLCGFNKQTEADHTAHFTAAALYDTRTPLGKWNNPLAGAMGGAKHQLGVA